MSVSLDEAWGEIAPPRVAPPPPSPHAAPGSRRAARRATTIEQELDLATCLASLEQVSAELKGLKTLFGKQQDDQKMVLYAAIGVVIILLLFTAHSYSRLQYASDCMLHWRR